MGLKWAADEACGGDVGLQTAAALSVALLRPVVEEAAALLHRKKGNRGGQANDQMENLSK